MAYELILPRVIAAMVAILVSRHPTPLQEGRQRGSLPPLSFLREDGVEVAFEEFAGVGEVLLGMGDRRRDADQMPSSR